MGVTAHAIHASHFAILVTHWKVPKFPIKSDKQNAFFIQNVKIASAIQPQI